MENMLGIAQVILLATFFYFFLFHTNKARTYSNFLLKNGFGKMH